MKTHCFALSAEVIPPSVGRSCDRRGLYYRVSSGPFETFWVQGRCLKLVLTCASPFETLAPSSQSS